MMPATMKFGLALLVLANCSLYACNAGYLGADSSVGREPARLASQINPQAIRLLGSPGQAASVREAGKSEPAGTPVPTVPLVAAPQTGQAAAAETGVAATSVAAPTAALQCIEIGNFDVADARSFDQQIAALALGERIVRRSVQEIERYIVYIPPLADKEGAERKAAELRRLGVDDFYVFNENTALRWGISLGVFKTAEAARVQLATLAQKGVRTAKVSARPAAAPKSVYQLRGLDAQAQAALAKIGQAFPRQQNRACAPA